MASVYASLGSNIDPEKNLRFAIAELRRRYGAVRVSPVYRSKSVGFEGDDFLNLVAAFESNRLPQTICADFEAIHNLAGRDRRTGKWESRPIDIDLLLYNDLVMDERPVRIPRSDILEYSFVLRPLAELAPDRVHPVTGRTMLEHWHAFDASSHPLELVRLDL